MVFKLAGDNKSYYVNHGLERGLNLDSLESALMNRDVLIKYPDHWTPLDPDNSSVHISKIEHEEETIFPELKRQFLISGQIKSLMISLVFCISPNAVKVSPVS